MPVRWLFALLLAGMVLAPVIAADASKRPNIVLILADDLGYGDLGCYGQSKIQTPHLDELAADGIRFTQCYAGSTVCAPSRCALMTGLHTGHCRTRGNGGGGSPRSNVPLSKTDPCIAEVLKKAGYTTALIGKWGLGEEGSTGVPNLKGFDHFYGYLNQHHAHNYYPDFLWRNWKKEPLPNVQSDVEGVAEKRVAYVPDLCRDEALKFIEVNHERPFFLFFSTTVPHANNERTKVQKNGNEVPSDAPYTKQPWPQPEKDKAAMITRMDADIGAILEKLKRYGLDEKTVVIFSSDNGPHREGGNDPAFFQSSGPFRGIKRSLTDGGIRVPGIVRWTGVTKPGTVSDHIWAFWDVLPTAAELAKATPPAGLDGISFAPTILGKGDQLKHRYLYWEFHEGGFKQAIRRDNWKAIRLGSGQPFELYDVKSDPGETRNVAALHPDVVKNIEDDFATARTDSTAFPVLPAKRK